MFKYANSRTAIRKAALMLPALILNVTVATQFAFCDTAPPFWPPPSPLTPDDGIYSSPFTFNSLSNGGTIEPDAGPDVRLAARWQLLGGPVAPPLAQAMAQEAEAQRQRSAQQLPGGAGAPGMPTWISLGPTTQNRWTLGFSLGLPNPQINSGRLSSILVNPVNPDTVYVVASSGGLWKTTNFSQPNPSWSPKSDGIVTTEIGAGALGKSPDTIYLGTGDPFASQFGVYVVRSTDGGNTWAPGVQLPAASTLDLKVDTSGASDIVLVGTNDGLFRSANGGASFASVSGFAGSSVWSLAQTSAGWLAIAESNSTGQATIYYSTNHGATWLPIPNNGSVYAGAGRTTLAVGRPGDAVVYAFAATTFDGVQLDLFRSTDGGLNWSALGLAQKRPLNFDPFQQDMNLMADQAFYNQMVLVDPTDPSRDTVYLGGQLASAKTTDGGATWVLTSTWLPLRGPGNIVGKLPYVHADFHCAAFAVNGRRNYLMVGSDGGLFVSTDGGSTWDDTKNQGLVTHLIRAMSVNAKNTDETLVGTQDNGVLYRRPNSTSFDGVYGADGGGNGWSQANNGISIAATQFSRFIRSVNNPPNMASKFVLATNGIFRSEGMFNSPMTTPTAVADPTGLKFFTYTVTRIYRTNDGAAQWNVIGQSGVNIPAGRQFQGQHGLSVSPVDANKIAATAARGWVVLSPDGGASWTQKQLIGTGPAPGYGGINVASAWAGDHIIYVGSASPDVSRNHVVKSTDGGQTWQVADGGLPRLAVEKIVLDPTDASGNTVYLANIIGVYRTTDGGATWNRFGNGLPQADITDLYIPADGSFLRASSYGRGVWEIPLH